MKENSLVLPACWSLRCFASNHKHRNADILLIPYPLLTQGFRQSLGCADEFIFP